MKKTIATAAKLPTFEELMKKNAAHIANAKMASKREIHVSGRLKFYNRPVKDEVALLYFARDPALSDSDLMSIHGVPVVLQSNQNDPGHLSPEEATFSYHFTTSEDRPLCLIMSFQNALSVQSKTFFKGNTIKVDFTDPKQVKGGQSSLMPQGRIPVGNLNGDRWIDILDYGRMLYYFGQYCTLADLNKDDKISEPDVKILCDCFLKCSAVEIPAALNWVTPPNVFP